MGLRGIGTAIFLPYSVLCGYIMVWVAIQASTLQKLGIGGFVSGFDKERVQGIGIPIEGLGLISYSPLALAINPGLRA